MYSRCLSVFKAKVAHHRVSDCPKTPARRAIGLASRLAFRDRLATVETFGPLTAAILTGQLSFACLCAVLVVVPGPATLGRPTKELSK
jgi:hypothetical protein